MLETIDDDDIRHIPFDDEDPRRKSLIQARRIFANPGVE
jgi:hypothetical protein